MLIVLLVTYFTGWVREEIGRWNLLKGWEHGLINNIDTKAKCRHLKKSPVKAPPLLGFFGGDLAILYVLNLVKYRVLNS